MLKLFHLILLSILWACGADDDSGPSLNAHMQFQAGVYEARLLLLNPLVSPQAQGWVTIDVTASNVTISLNAQDLDPGIEHPQYIYAGGSCPTAAQDFNNDGFIDQTEMEERAQEALVPLDNNLNSKDIEAFPMASAGRRLDYTQQADITVFQNLKLDNRIIIIHGVAGFDVLPETVGERGELDPEREFPILCGRLRRVK